ncbi:MAG TPA: ABC transporter permease [Acidimicrobiia bacterium]|nr:ABC transporter permease [Acidimicrobiia bacterium]
MLKTALRSLQANKLRFGLTALSVVMGVAFVAGSFVFTDTIQARFDTLFDDVYAGVDATVRIDETATVETSFDESYLTEVRAVPGVDRAEGSVSGSAQILDRNGETLGGIGSTTLGFSWVADPALNVGRIGDGDGRAPVGPGEVVIDKYTAEANGFAVGDTIQVLTEQGVGHYQLVGVAAFGTEDNLAGATIAAFDFDEAQRLFGLEGRLDTIDVVAADDVAEAELLADLATAMPTGTEAVTGQQQTQEQLDDVTAGLGFLNVALLAFAGISVFVGAFVISNTFRITVAQRIRELGLLRAVGATTSQVNRLVLIEAAVLAVLASALGVLAGIGVAELVRVGLDAVGIALPDGPLRVEPRTVIVGFTVGVGVTLVAAILPARRAASVSPMAAIAAVDTRTPRKSLRNRAIVGSSLSLAGAGALVGGLTVQNGASLGLVGGGAAVVFFGISTLAPLIAAPVARVISSPFQSITGKLARENTVRAPRRTASTASALMIGVTLVALVSVFAASIKVSISDTMETNPADLIVNSFADPLSTEVTDTALANLQASPEFDVVSPVTFGWYSIEGVDLDVAAVDPATLSQVWNGAPSIDLADMGDGLMVHVNVMEDNGWAVGDVVDVEYVAGTVPTEIVGTFETSLLANTLVSHEVYGRNVGHGPASFASIRLAEGVSLEAGEAAAKADLAGFPTLQVQTRSESIETAETQIDQLVSLFSGLLGLALIIAVLGIANTLALSIVERTREIGLLRAVGMSRRQVRSMVRIEASVTAVFGALLGMAMGTGLGFALVRSLQADGLASFAIPYGQLVVWVALAALAGVAAAIGPARKASRLDILRAISYQ